MKLDLSPQQREALEITLDVLHEHIDSLCERKEDLLDKSQRETGALLAYQKERVHDLNRDIMELKYIQESLERIS